MPAKTPSPNAYVRKSLFAGAAKEASPEGVKLNSQGFVLPVIDCQDEEAGEKETSTDTYIAGPPSPRLSTIQEEESVSKSATQSTTVGQETTVVKSESLAP